MPSAVGSLGIVLRIILIPNSTRLKSLEYNISVSVLYSSIVGICLVEVLPC